MNTETRSGSNRPPRVMLNPSCQFSNVVTDELGEDIYNEALTMYDIALAVHQELKCDGRVDVYLSRDSREESSTLRRETQLAPSLNCDAFVSLHSDATGEEDNPGGGTWSFYADDEGKRLAESVQTRLLESIRSFYPEVIYRGVRTHWKRLWVLHETPCPAALTEVLFHGNPKERQMLNDPDRQGTMARAIARGILDYFSLT